MNEQTVGEIDCADETIFHDEVSDEVLEALAAGPMPAYSDTGIYSPGSPCTCF